MRQYISLSHQFLPQLTLPGDNDHIYHFAVKGRFNTQQINDTCNVLFTSGRQGRIYVANEYHTFVRTMSMVGQKLTFSRQITSNARQNLSVLMKNMQILR